MPTTPWKKCANPDPDRNYVAFLTYLPLKRYSMVPRFLFYTVRVLVQLSKSDGLIGYSLRADLIKNNFWTLSLWENEAALRGFAFSGFHKGVMKLLRKHMGPTRFIKWAVTGADALPSWDDAMRQFDKP